MKKVSIITVNFNQPQLTEQLLRSIPDTYANLEVIVVDNGSTVDATIEWRKTFAGITFIRSADNCGFAGGNNIGIKQATGDYLFLVNNDTEFTNGLIETLVAVLNENLQVGMVSPKIKYFNNKDTIQYAGYTPMNYYTGRNSCIGLRETDKGQYDKESCPTAYCHGAAMMVRMEAIDKAGLMAENFFLYYEEIDWCERIKHEGYQAWVCTNALIYHKESVTVGKKSRLKEYFMNRNRILFIRRHASFFEKVIFYPYFILMVVPRNLLNYLKDKNYTFVIALLKAVWWNLCHNKNSNNLGYPIQTIK